MDDNIRFSPSLEVFKKSILNVIRPKENHTFDIHNPVGVKLLTRLRLGLSHLHEHKFKFNFQDCLNPLCVCNVNVENNTHFFLHCQNYNVERQILFDKIANINALVLNLCDAELVHVLLYGDASFSFQASVAFILETKRFDGPLI